MRRGKDRLIGAALCLLLLFGAGCSPAPGADQETLDRELDVQLGLLAEVITQEERSAAMDLWMRLRPVRQARLDRGEYRRGDREQELLEELNGLYEAYTIRYLGGDDLGWGYTDPEEHVLARYRIGGAGELTLMPNSLDLTHGPWTREDLEEMWESMQAVLPKDAFRDFRSYVPFTDGEGETVAYVLPADPGGSQWEICLDPADMGDRDYFLETVLHEYCHYLTLNHRQADYRGEPTVETYCEAGMVSREGSYLDDFCQQFWTGYLDDRPVGGHQRELRLLRAVGRAGVGGGVGGEAAVFPGLPGADGVPPPGAGEPGAGAAGAGGINAGCPEAHVPPGIFYGAAGEIRRGCGGTRGGQSPPGW